MTELRSVIRAVISNAYYDARNAGEGMEFAADRAADSVMEIVIERDVERDMRLAQAMRPLGGF